MSVLQYAAAPRGESHYRAKLTEADVRALRAIALERRQLLDRLAAISNRALAAKFEVTERCIDRVLYGQTWTHVGSVPNSSARRSAT